MKTCITCKGEFDNREFRRKGQAPFDECQLCRMKAAGKSAPRQRKKYKPKTSKDFLVSEDIPCMRCGTPVRVYVEPGIHITHKFCDTCRNRQRDGEVGDYSDSYGLDVGAIRFDFRCKTYRPGDAGFQQRAAEIMAHHAATP